MRIVGLCLVAACTPTPVLVPENGGGLALASQGGLSMVADPTAWGDNWGVNETLTPIAVDVRNGSKRKILVRGQDMALVDETGRKYDVFPLGARATDAPKGKTVAPAPSNSEQMHQELKKEEDKRDLPEEPPPSAPSKPKDEKKAKDGAMNIDWDQGPIDDDAAQEGADENGLQVVFTASAPPRGGGGGGGFGGSAPPRGGGGGGFGGSAPPRGGGFGGSAPPRYNGGYGAAPPRYNGGYNGGYNRGYGSRYYYGPRSRAYVGPGWGYGWGYPGYYGGYYGGFWDPYWGPYWGPRYGYGYYLYAPWNYARPAEDVMAAMVRVALLDTTLEPGQSTRGFVFFQYALDQANSLTLRWAPRDADTDEALPPLQTVFRVSRG